MPAQNFCREFFDSVDEAVFSLGYERFFYGWQPPWHFSAQEEYETMLAQAGFQSIQVQSRDYHLVFSAVSDVVHWWSSAGLRPYLAALPVTGQEHFKEAFGECFEQNMTGKGIEFDFRRLFAFARKA